MMADDVAEKAFPSETEISESHYCEYPGCVKRGSLGYDAGDGETQFFCHAHKWNDYRDGRSHRSFFEEEAAGIEALMVEPRRAALHK
ncbi:hypothetical protein [Rhizobium rhizogenes]|jgi:hypothetical protein|uniref:hypothetical protein n=1 Tax=Rhizobium rhizogenes TaxID=359 RepID=UPI00116E776E|nr:hypothetical protein [Rhizobium rhizogenes]NTF74619.1 hypothetical protein [Rhizobium rhizogenes]NTH55858.1 hypothetical protein [Rhizobium rhizogenes]NTH75478.1 hypothetical protein [Rhizobium rhizogenes]NTI88507.1 hypothetical protein [Rhizobium rhizogenes]TRB25574.1 hypothetical protein EXN70_00090 [Rhizobium rhizogenes]